MIWPLIIVGIFGGLAALAVRSLLTPWWKKGRPWWQ